MNICKGFFTMDDEMCVKCKNKVSCILINNSETRLRDILLAQNNGMSVVAEALGTILNKITLLEDKLNSNTLQKQESTNTSKDLSTVKNDNEATTIEASVAEVKESKGFLGIGKKWGKKNET